MKRSIEVHVPRRLIERARDYGEMVVDAYRRGQSERSRLAGVPERRIDHKLEWQFMGRLCEVAGCLSVGLNPDESMNWHKAADPGFDFRFGKRLIDVKGTWHTRGRMLIWPSSKTHFFDTAMFDTLMLVKARPPGSEDFGRAWALGWVTKADFRRKKIEITKETSTFWGGLEVGTWFMDKDWLEPMDTLTAHEGTVERGLERAAKQAWDSGGSPDHEGRCESGEAQAAAFTGVVK